MEVLLFDFGGVIIKTPFELVPALERRLGLDPIGWHGPFDPVRDPLWLRLTRREITEREYWRRRALELAPVLGSDTDPVRSLFEAMYDLDESDIVRPETRALVDRAAGQKRLAVLTNDLGRFHSPEWKARMSILGRFETVIDLSEWGVLKPHPDAYEVALAQLGVAAHDVLFVDDQPANVAGARSVGLHAIGFDVTSPASSVAAVAQALG